MEINLTALRRFDSNILELLDSACQVAVYAFNSATNQWEKTDAEGALFVCRRSSAPAYSFVIPNRLNRQNFTEAITPDLEVAENNQYLLYRKGAEYIRAVWFFNKDDCAKISTLISKLSGLLKQPQTGTAKTFEMDPQNLLASGQKEKPIGESDIVSLLNRAQLKYDMKCGNQGLAPSQPPRTAAAPLIAKPVPVAISSLMQTAAGVSSCNNVPSFIQPQQLSTNQNRAPISTPFSAITGLVNKDSVPGIVAKMSSAADNNQSHVTSSSGNFPAGVPNLLQRLLAAPKMGDGLVDESSVGGVPSVSPPSIDLHSSAHVLQQQQRPIVGQQQQQPQRHLSSPSPNSFSSTNSNSAGLPMPANGTVFLQTPKARTATTPDHVINSVSSLSDPINQSALLLTPASLGRTFNDLGCPISTNHEAPFGVQGNNDSHVTAAPANKISPTSSTGGSPLFNENAFVQAFSNLMRTDKNFCMKLHQEYMRSLDHYLANSMNN